MRLIDLQCDGFRCLKDLRFAPAPGINVIRGENAQGKTSILEAILYASTSKSHRTNVESDLVAHGEEGFHIALQGRRSDRDVTLEANHWLGSKRIKVNGVPQSRVSDILGKISVVLFSPEDIALIKGGASVRRKFLDMELSQLHPPYLNALQQYRQVLRQRNETLRARRVDSTLLDVWDEQLARFGTELVRRRTDFVGDLSARAEGIYADIAQDESLQLRYNANVPIETPMAEALRDSRDADIKRAMTTRGPHRDDIDVTISETPARSQASQGQQKTAALAIRLAELDLIKDRTEEYPILLLDEVLAELDDARANRLFSAIPSGVQCILTTTEPSDRRIRFQGAVTNFYIRQGVLRAAEVETSHTVE